MALGLLKIPLTEFKDMKMVHIYWNLKSWKDERLYEENGRRINAFYTIAPHWSGDMPLKFLWQIWRIPEIDGDIKKDLPLAMVTNIKNK